MTLDERKKAAEQAIDRCFHGMPSSGLAAVAIEAAFPELFTSPPTMWPAPMEMTDEMAGGERWPDRQMQSLWRVMRDAHLNREGK